MILLIVAFILVFFLFLTVVLRRLRLLEDRFDAVASVAAVIKDGVHSDAG